MGLRLLFYILVTLHSCYFLYSLSENSSFGKSNCFYSSVRNLSIPSRMLLRVFSSTMHSRGNPIVKVR